MTPLEVMKIQIENFKLTHRMGISTLLIMHQALWRWIAEHRCDKYDPDLHEYMLSLFGVDLNEIPNECFACMEFADRTNRVPGYSSSDCVKDCMLKWDGLSREQGGCGALYTNWDYLTMHGRADEAAELADEIAALPLNLNRRIINAK